ncbi:P-type II D ATPase [Basidiobolus meristosporus CBS 931.73]|uniref:P-type II D ATPase n=1 Tax=Basidiobolus meristosporus CBS 931.73 TaxID=1314790 RepID=A0A1Y1VS27_9FUNG|nr:P-type II D ATPase [Basidiobolus meristosporus CBS 931.73]|eukprot:ORX63816.1 P-type II D ATPase [Basidiobolus meristosporus CBS 931.73]
MKTKKSFSIDLILDPNEPIGDRLNLVYSSTSVTRGRGRGIVIGTGMTTEIGKIAQELANNDNKPGKTPLQKSLDKMAYLLFLLAIIFILIVFAVNRFKINQSIAVYAISIGIAVIPGGLIAVVTFTMAIGVRKMAKERALVRQLPSLEALGSISNICSDKTGTLTQAKMVLTRFWLPESGYYHVTGTGINPTGCIIRLGDKKILDPQMIKEDGVNVVDSAREMIITPENMPSPIQRLVETAALCNMAMIKQDDNSKEWINIGDPTETALQVFAHKLNSGKPTYTTDADPSNTYTLAMEFPFESAIKRMSVIYKEERTGKYIVYLKGAFERIIGCCTKVKYGDSEQPTEQQQLESLLEPQIVFMASQGLRVLGLAYRILDEEMVKSGPSAWTRENIEQGFTFVGLGGIYDPPRLESRSAVLKCYQAGIQVHMLTGDHPATAEAIAREVAILPPEGATNEKRSNSRLVMTAGEFDSLTEEEIDALPELPRVIARCSPNTKVKMIRAFHRRQKIVAMTGDGVNDSPSLKIADVGIAMGKAGSDVAKQASDIILTDDNFATIVGAIAEGRRVFANFIKFVQNLLSGNLACVLVLMIALAIKDDQGSSVYPLSPVQILFYTLATSTPPSMALGMEPATPEIMRQKPHSGGLFTFEVILDNILYGCVMGLLSLLNFVLVVFVVGSGEIGRNCNQTYSDSCAEIYRGRAAAYAAITVLILIHCFNCRSLRSPQWTWAQLKDIYSNRFLFWSVISGFLLLFPCIYIPGLNTTVFRHKGISWEWGLVAADALIFITLSELYKWTKRRFMASTEARVDEAFLNQVEHS